VDHHRERVDRLVVDEDLHLDEVVLAVAIAAVAEAERGQGLHFEGEGGVAEGELLYGVGGAAGIEHAETVGPAGRGRKGTSETANPATDDAVACFKPAPLTDDRREDG
jgi:hypothetical protein